MKIFQSNQYDSLHYYLMCYPVNFKITDKNNKYYGDINYESLYQQYNNFVNTLIEEGIKIRFIDINSSEQQVFTKDIGFVIEDIFFVSNMKKQERKIETKTLKKLIEDNNLKYYEMKNNIEGGDVIHHGGEIFVGISTRTCIEATYELQKVLNEKNIDIKVVPIYFDTNKLHLDCVFNTLDKDSCVMSPYVYNVDEIEKYIKFIYHISKEEADKLGTNLVYLGDKKVISSNKEVVNILNNNGYKAKFVEYKEIMKAGGSLACSTLSLLRHE